MQPLLDQMEQLNEGGWLRLKTHLDRGGEEIFFSFLLKNATGLEEILDIFLKSVADALCLYPETDFNMAFYQMRKDRQLILDSFDNDGIRSPETIEYPLGQSPVTLNAPIPESWWGL